MKCIECNEVELEFTPGRGRPRKFCSKKCANDWHHAEKRRNYKSVKKNPDWGKAWKAKQAKIKANKELLEQLQKTHFTITDIMTEYGISKSQAHLRSKLGEVKGIRSPQKGRMHYTKEQARFIGTTCTSQMNTETAKAFRTKTNERARRNTADPVKGAKKRARHRAYKQEKRKDPKYRLRASVSLQMNTALKKQGKMKQWAAFEKTGYTPQQLAEHVEAQFDDKMTWDNYGTYWQLDHIVPQCVLQYDSMDHPNFAKCWALENLQPLRREENTSKGSLYEGVRHKW
tara:strand:- start:3 stop:860 length:858 start_codon:yes stop_codon:yes gene_type:complete